MWKYKEISSLSFSKLPTQMPQETYCKSQKAKKASSIMQKQLPCDSLAQIFYRNPML